MSFGAAISSVFSKYATFSGRARRSEYWFWHLFLFLSSVVLNIADRALNFELPGYDNAAVGPLAAIFAVIVLIPTIAVTIRRLHDTGRTGWWWLISLFCCVGSIVIFVFSLVNSQPGTNQYGPNPKGQN